MREFNQNIDKDEWVLATKNNKRRGRRHTFNSSRNISNDNKNICHDRYAVDDEDPDITQSQICTRLARLKSDDFFGKFLSSVISILDRILDGRRLAMIRAIGLGSFGGERDSALQLILLETIKEYFRVPFVTSQDPITTPAEKYYMHSRDIKVLQPDDLLSDPPTFSQENGVTLLYMIHCYIDMYEKVLSRYSRNMENLILIGNCSRSVPMVLNVCQNTYRHFSAFSKTSTMIPMSFFDDKAFYGTAISFVESGEERRNEIEQR